MYSKYCSVCRGFFSSHRRDARFCSGRCRVRAFRSDSASPSIAKFCLNCGDLLLGRQVKYCSNRCKLAFRRALLVQSQVQLRFK